MLRIFLIVFIIGWTGTRCETDIDECALGIVSCGPGDCLNLDGTYTCVCAAGFCGAECALLDPCAQPAADNRTGPCQNNGKCTQRCSTTVDWECECVDGWAGKNCTEAGALGSVGSSTRGVVVGVGAALLCVCAAGALLAALAAQARRKRATRGTYSPSGQEYCNPRAEMMHHALKPPPEERLI